METNIQFTRLRDNDNAIAKQISWDGNRLHKESKASVKDGNVESIHYSSWDKLRDHLTNIPKDECIVLGRLKHGKSGRIVGSKEAQDLENGLFSRSLENFCWCQGLQLCCIDYDGSKAGDLTPNEVVTIIDDMLPGFADVTKVVKYSSGAWIYTGDDELRSTSNGFHIYFMVNRPDLIADIFKGSSSLLHKKLWLDGHGYIKNSRPKDRRTTAVSQMERTLYDNTVFSPERIIFEASPILSSDLYKTNQEAFITGGDTGFLDLEQYKPLQKQAENEYQKLVKEAKLINENDPYVVESRKIFKDHVKERVKRGDYKKRKEYSGLSADEIADREFVASRKGVLMQDHEINLASGVSVTVEAMMKAPEKYHGQRCYDPHEPKYSKSPIAIIYTDQKEPKIFSQAHGGITYLLVRDDQKASPDFCSRDYWLEHFYLVTYDKKDEIYHIYGNKIDKYSHSGFTHTFAGYYTDVGDEDQPKKIPMTKWWMGNIEKKRITGDGFTPGKPIIYHQHGNLVINEYVPDILRHGLDIPDIEQYRQSAFPWIAHIHTMIHDKKEADILVDWFAYLVQHPHERPMFSPLILSETRGVGKDMMSDIWSEMMGHKYAKKSSVEALSKADSWGDVFHQTKLITVSECGSSQDRYTIGNNIKDKITARSLSMNLKGKEMLFGNVFAGIIFYSNSISPFSLDKGDRRFFVTRCDWTKSKADGYKSDGYFSKLASIYSDPVHLHGLYHYLLNRDIKTNMKGDAPMTSTKEIMMVSEPNETEQFFVDLKNHPCRYWTTSMIKDLYKKEVSNSPYDDITDNKQFRHFLSEMVSAGKLKVKGKTPRLKTFSMKDAEQNNKTIRMNIELNWEITTNSLHPVNTPSGVQDISRVCSGEKYS